MSFKIRFSRSVARDIEYVLEYTFEQFGSEQLSVYKALIRAALADIAADPRRPGAKWRQELHRNVRTYHLSRRGKEASHYFVYRIRGEEIIEVSRLLHDAMDLRQHLPEGLSAG